MVHLQEIDKNDCLMYFHTTGLALSEMPWDLTEKLRKKLDVRHKGEYGWRKLGNAFEIDRDDLNCLELSYQRPGGSPTKELLETLITLDRTVGDLINKLADPKVNRRHLALLVLRRTEEKIKSPSALEQI